MNSANSLKEFFSTRRPSPGVELAEASKVILGNLNNPSLVQMKCLLGLTDTKQVQILSGETPDRQDRTKIVNYLREIAGKNTDGLNSKSLLQMSKSLFRADLFSDASNVLAKVLKIDPKSSAALRAYKNQYYYTLSQISGNPLYLGLIHLVYPY